jgi:RNA polymerase sigma factor (sigma-70 family)
MESQKQQWAIANLETDIWLETNLVEGEMLKVIHSAVKQLPYECGNIIKMYLEGLSTDEISNRLKISAATVRSQKRHAIQLLRIALQNRQLVILAPPYTY